jgi:hypothetical protein
MSRIPNTGKFAKQETQRRYSVDERRKRRKEGEKEARSVPHFGLKILKVIKAVRTAEVRSFTERIGGSNTRREREQKEQTRKASRKKVFSTDPDRNRALEETPRS